jgi:hypothetical protein
MKIIWVTAAILIAVTLAGATYYQQQQTPELADRRALVESVLKDRISELLQDNQTSTINNVTLLSTPNLYGVKVSEHILGVSIQTMTRDQIDALSKTKPVDYWYFDKISKTDPYTASVDLNYVWGYSNGHRGLDDESGSYFVCSRATGNWISSSNGGWIP